MERRDYGVSNFVQYSLSVLCKYILFLSFF